jgi:soluble lytic murein transglycosylase-like protein
MLKHDILKHIYGFFVILLLLLFCESALAASLRYKLAMMGYDDKEIANIISRKRTIRKINHNYKRSMLGYSRAEPSSTSFFRKKEKRVSKKIILAPLVRRKSPSIRSQNLSLYMKNSLLTEAKPYLTIIQDAASKNELVKSLILAVIKVESGFDSQAVSRKGAMGLMQLMPGTASDLGVTKPLDPEQNIFGGTKYLSDCLRTFKDLKLALAAYNAGPGRVAKLKRVPMIKETQKYVKDVIYYKKLYDHLLIQTSLNG